MSALRGGLIELGGWAGSVRALMVKIEGLYVVGVVVSLGRVSLVVPNGSPLANDRWLLSVVPAT